MTFWIPYDPRTRVVHGHATEGRTEPEKPIDRDFARDVRCAVPKTVTCSIVEIDGQRLLVRGAVAPIIQV